MAVVDEVKDKLSSSSAALLTEYRGMKVGELAELRRNLRKSGGEFKIYKNTLVRFAVRDLGIDIDEATLTGPTAIAFVDGDAAGVAKALRDYSRTNANLVLKGGVLGAKALTADETRALADLPSREVLLAQLAGALQAPLVKMAGLLQALPRNMAYGLKALIDQKVAGGEAAPAPAEAEAPAAEEADAPAPTATDEAEAPAEADVSENEAAAEQAAAEEAPGAPAAEAEATESTESTESTEATESTETTAEEA
ncbi:MAG: large subunit ribosomal protein [Actinomycetota bacterium]|nr:large subunit ribosomal protein [Actinomycetota bacterium]